MVVDGVDLEAGADAAVARLAMRMLASWSARVWSTVVLDVVGAKVVPGVAGIGVGGGARR